MIQDIAPHRLDRAYSLRPPCGADAALCYRDGAVLLCRRGEEYALPRFAREGIAPEGARRLFALDGVDCYLAQAPEETPAGCEYVPMQALRRLRPRQVSFAAVTGAQLHRWYQSHACCGRCGAAMAPGTAERSMVCPVCGLTEYPRICPAVIVAVTDGDRLLLTRYADRPYRGEALIAGFVEIGETPEDTVRREVMEEVGLRVKDIRYYKSQPWGFTDTLLLGFFCRLNGSGAITLDRQELKEAFWVQRQSLTPRTDEASLTSEMIERFRMGRDPFCPEGSQM